MGVGGFVGGIWWFLGLFVGVVVWVLGQIWLNPGGFVVFVRGCEVVLGGGKICVLLLLLWCYLSVVS